MKILKKCSSCKEPKSLDEFGKGTGSYGKKNYCKICSNKKASEHYEKNKEKRRKQMIEYNKSRNK